MSFQLPPLPYKPDALNPYIDQQTMELHHGKHHAGYVAKLNSALEKAPHYFEKSIEDVLRSLAQLPEDIRTAVANNGGGHLNHSLFWKMLSPTGGGLPHGELLNKIKDQFGGFENFKEKFTELAVNHFGSGWAWLVSDEKHKLQLLSTPNQDSPISLNKHPLLGIDLWEHAYYLKYQNRRPEYISAFWNIVDWKQVENNLIASKIK